MKIHIDTADEKEKAQAKNIAKKPAPTAAKPTAKQSATSNTSAKPQPKPNLPKSPPKEPKAPKDVVTARKNQTNILQARQSRELQGKNDAFREQAGVGYWPTISPFL
jgi:hypothetical protein